WYWFVSAIVLSYPIYFLLARHGGATALGWAIVALIPLYAALYLTVLDLKADSLEATRFKWIFYGQMMLLGGWVARRGIARVRGARWGLGAAIVGFVAFKLGAGSMGLMPWQWLLHAQVALFVVALYSLASAWPLATSAWRWLVALLAPMAYEMYLVQ